MIHGGGCLGNHGPPMAELDPSAYSTSGWVELKSLSRAGPWPTPGSFFFTAKSSKSLSTKSTEKSYKKESVGWMVGWTFYRAGGSLFWAGPGRHRQIVQQKIDFEAVQEVVNLESFPGRWSDTHPRGPITGIVGQPPERRR